MRGQFSGPPGVKGQTSIRHFYQFTLPKMIYNYSAFFPLVSRQNPGRKLSALKELVLSPTSGD